MHLSRSKAAAAVLMTLGLTLSGVLGNLRPATQALSPLYLARLLRP